MVASFLIRAGSLEAASAPATWNPAAKNATVTLSSSDLVAQKTSTDNWAGVQATVGRSTGKYYFGIQQTGSPWDSANFWMVFGLSVAAGNFTNSHPGDTVFSTNGLGLQGQGTVHRNGMSAGSGSVGITTSADLDTVNFAVDMDNGEIWVNYNGTYGGSQDPATRTNPHTTFTPGLTLFPSAAMYSEGTNYEHRAKLLIGANLTTSPPSGYSSW